MKQVGGVEVPQEAFLAVSQPRLRQEAVTAAVSGVAHLYVHLPFCVHRCGYCDFVTLVGRHGEHGRYVDALPAELELERALLADRVETVFLGGGTPTFTRRRCARAAARGAAGGREVTVEANPGDRDARAGSAACATQGSTRVSLGAQSFQPRLLDVLERAPARTTSGARCTLSVMPDLTTSRSISSTGSPARAPPISTPISRRRSRSRPSTSPATSSRRSRARGSRMPGGTSSTRQAEAMEGYFEHVVETLVGAGYRWYETANFCLAADARRAATFARSTTWATGTPATTSVSASGRSPPSTASGGGTRRGLRGYLEALERGERPPREVELLDDDDPCTGAADARPAARRAAASSTRALEGALDEPALARLTERGLIDVVGVHAAAAGDPADRSRPAARRRRHRRAARLERAAVSRLSSRSYHRSMELPREAGDSPARRRGVRLDRAAGRARSRSSRTPASAPRRPRCAGSSPSSRRSVC